MAYMGPNRDPKTHFQEFGTAHHGPQPYMRPAWDEHKARVPAEIGKNLWAEIQKTAKRKARREARAAAKAAG